MAKKYHPKKIKILPSQEEEEDNLPPLSPNLNFEYESKIWWPIKDVVLVENCYYNIKLNNLIVFINTVYKDNCFYISKNKKIDKEDVEFCYLVEKN
jgi:hypothetical protein